MKKIAILGTGGVGKMLAQGFSAIGYDVVMGTQNPATKTDIKAVTYEEAVQGADMVVLAVKGLVAEDVVKRVAPQLAGKTVIDTTNPIAAKPPEKGMLSFFTTFDQSLMERLQMLAPEAKFVKAFSCVGNSLMVNPKFKEGKPTMFICGNDQTAKQEVTAILDQFGWEAQDFGGVEGARAIEPFCILWCAPGFLANDWMHTYKLLKN